MKFTVLIKYVRQNVDVNHYTHDSYIPRSCISSLMKKSLNDAG